MIVNVRSKLTLMSTIASEDQMQEESNFQPVMLKEDLKGSFSNGVPMQEVQNVDTFSISSVILVLLLLFLLVGTMWMIDVTMNTGGCMVDGISSTISFFIMCVMVQIFKIPTVCTSDTRQLRQTSPHFHFM